MRKEAEEEEKEWKPSRQPTPQQSAAAAAIPPPPIGNEKAERAIRAFLSGFPPPAPKRGLAKHALTVWGKTGCGKSSLVKRCVALEGYAVSGNTDMIVEMLSQGRSLAKSIDGLTRNQLGKKRKKKKTVVVLDDFVHVVDSSVITALAQYLSSPGFVKRNVPIILVFEDRFDSKFKSLTRSCFDVRLFPPFASSMKPMLSKRVGSYRASRIAAACNGDIRQALMMARYGESLGARDARQNTFDLCSSVMRNSDFDRFAEDDELLVPMLFENYPEEYGCESVTLGNGMKCAESVDTLASIADAFSLDDALGYGNNAEQVLRCIHSKIAARPFFGGDRKLGFPGRAAFGVTPTTDDKRRRELARKLGLPKDPAEAGVAMRLKISSLSKNRHKMVQFKAKHQLEDDDVKLMHAIASRK